MNSRKRRTAAPRFTTSVWYEKVGEASGQKKNKIIHIGRAVLMLGKEGNKVNKAEHQSKVLSSPSAQSLSNPNPETTADVILLGVYRTLLKSRPIFHVICVTAGVHLDKTKLKSMESWQGFLIQTHLVLGLAPFCLCSRTPGAVQNHKPIYIKTACRSSNLCMICITCKHKAALFWINCKDDIKIHCM